MVASQTQPTPQAQVTPASQFGQGPEPERTPEVVGIEPRQIDLVACGTYWSKRSATRGGKALPGAFAHHFVRITVGISERLDRATCALFDFLARAIELICDLGLGQGG